MKDLFETPELIPDNVADVLNLNDYDDYESLQSILIEVEKLGYTFDFDLHCEVSNLRVMTFLDHVIKNACENNEGDTELLTTAYNRLPDHYKEVIDEMFIYKGIVYFNTHLHIPKEQTFEIVNHDFNAETHEQIKTYIDKINN